MLQSKALQAWKGSLVKVQPVLRETRRGLEGGGLKAEGIKGHLSGTKPPGVSTE